MIFLILALTLPSKGMLGRNVIYSPNAERDLNVVFISDTHGLHEHLKLPDGIDLLVHAGDFTATGSSTSEYTDFTKWFALQEAKHKVLISGNRDLFLDSEQLGIENMTIFRNELLKMFENRGIKYLEDSGTTIEGLKIYGTPWTRVYSGNAFQIEEEQLQEKFEKIPSNLDILISHSPPYGILDRNSKGVSSGSSSLLKTVTETKPRIHVFGHIHEGHGTSEKAKPNEPYFINAAMQKTGDIGTKPSRMTEKEWMIFQKSFPQLNLPVFLQIKIKNKI